jgi:ribosomal protein L11 methyltransferase
MLYAELDPFEPLAIQERDTGDGWRVFFRTRPQRDAACRALASEFENALDLRAVDVEDEDWARRSQQSLNAIRAGRIVVAPPWDVPPDTRDSRFEIRDSAVPSREPRAASRDVIIIIDPSTGFGTGHHATTRLCLELLQEIDLRHTRVIDIGTGSGVLAIAAAKLAAREVIAIDNDPDALRNARENVRRNDVDVEIVEADLAAISVAPADIVLANLTAAVLQRFASPIRTLTAVAGTQIVSGFGVDDAEDVARAMGAAASTMVRDGEWAALRLTSINDLGETDP